VVVDAFPDSAFRHLGRDALVCIDVMLASTTLVTAVAQGRRALVASSPDQACEMAAALDRPLLAGRATGPLASRFELGDSPACLTREGDTSRALVLYSPPGTELIRNADGAPAILLACFRNLLATAANVARHHRDVAVLTAGFHEELSCEDQMAAARIVESLIRHGFQPGDLRTAALARRWSGIDLSLAALGNSAAQLHQGGQGEDVDFILAHTDDLPFACAYQCGEVRRADSHPARSRPEAWVADGAVRPGVYGLRADPPGVTESGAHERHRNR
jgi:phosphosulfolactate phosphohydrolase-like enzyme